MKTIVTGASGRIGTEVISQLKEKGHDLIAFDLTTPNPKLDGVTYIQGDLNDSKLVHDLIENANQIVHLAAFMSWNSQDHKLMSQHNIQGTLNFLNIASQQQNSKLKRFVFASTGEVYPEVLPQYTPIDESHPLKPSSFYGETKKIGEELVHFFQRQFQIPSVILRFPHTQQAIELLDPSSFFSGPRFFLQPKIKQMQLFNKPEIADMLSEYDTGKLAHILQCDKLGKSYKMHISDVRDTAQGVILALTHPNALGETFNLATDQPVVFSDILPLMQEITQCEIVKAKLPGPPVNYETSNKKIKEKLGYQPQFPFNKMLEESAVFWNTHNAKT